ncbi:hypothetical protein PLEOSDRAFT_154688 [Pleurotus ostreatus PC15]|uniref:Uncharacterized protein n=2 Tax=Pleurotus TaxID=5320 RepID=A0A067NPW9_PLEO1|nr:hypothetical protein CCMSSC00406_0007586 [Pleurotus cornucopiae]KDQ29964.1 hypothetical protein PLEOSDRAFT_154688 [Pleurotus ostreatus PC15]
MSNYRFDSRSQFSPLSSETFSDSVTQNPPRGLPGYDWSDSSNRRAQDYSRDSAQPERVFHPPAYRTDHTTGSRLLPQEQARLYDLPGIGARDFLATQGGTPTPPPTRRFGSHLDGDNVPAAAAVVNFGHAEDTSRQTVNFVLGELHVLRRQVCALEEAVLHIQRHLGDLRANQVDPTPQLRSFSPHLAPSDSILRANSEDDGEDIRVAYAVYQREWPSLRRPSHLPESVLWTLKDAQARGPDGGFSSSNPHRLSFKKALRDQNGNILDEGIVKLITRTATGLARRIMALQPANTPDHLLGQAVLKIRTTQRSSTTQVGKASHSQDSHSTPKKPKRTANVITPLPAGPSKRACTGSEQAASVSRQAHPFHEGSQGDDSLPPMPGSPSPSRPPYPTAVSARPLSPLKSSAAAGLLARGSFGTEFVPLSAAKVDDDFDNLRVTLQSPEFAFNEVTIESGLALLDAMEHAQTHGGNGFPSNNTAALLARVQGADPSCIDDEDNLFEGWGHWQWTTGSLTITTAIGSWQDVGNTNIARQLIAAALVTCKAARLLCMEHPKKPCSYISDSYVEQLIETLFDAWKRSGGPLYKGKGRETERPAERRRPQPEVVAEEPVEPLGEDPALGEGNDIVSGASDVLTEPEGGLKSKLSLLHLSELKHLVAKSQIAGGRQMNKAKCISSLMGLPPTTRPSIDTIEDQIAKRPAPVKKPKPATSKPTKPSVVSQPPTSPPRASGSSVPHDLNIT